MIYKYTVENGILKQGSLFQIPFKSENGYTVRIDDNTLVNGLDYTIDGSRLWIERDIAGAVFSISDNVEDETEVLLNKIGQVETALSTLKAGVDNNKTQLASLLGSLEELEQLQTEKDDTYTELFEALKTEIDGNTSSIETLSDNTSKELETYIDLVSDVEKELREHIQAVLNTATSNHSAIKKEIAVINDRLVRDGNNSMYVYTSNAKYVIDNGTGYLVNPRATASAENDNISYDKNNSFKVLETKKLSDGNTVYYFENGTAVIVSDDDNNNTVYVKKSGDIVIKKDKIYEIITNNYGYSKGVINCSDGKKVTYFDNGAAIITDTNGNNIYVEDSDEILYDGNKNVIGTPSHSKETSKKTTTDGYDVVNFNNGKSQVIKDDGTSFIIDTDKLIFDSDGAITSDDNKDDEKDNEDKPQEPDDTDDEEEREDPLEGMYVSEAEHSYEDDRTKNNQYSNFIIRNDNTRTKRFRIVIEEVDNYSKYNASRLSPNYVKFQATVGDSFVGPNMLDNNTWTDENGKVNYVIYDGSIRAKSSLEVSVNLYVDYAILSNREQDKTFIGTIKVYVNE